MFFKAYLMQKIATLLLLSMLLRLNGYAQNSDTTFFPQFQPYNNNPVIKYGDGFSDAAWNDPVILKENGQYIMYISAANGITGTDHVKIYRMLSADGYSWTLSPTMPLLQPIAGTYYEGGTETPSVVHFNNQYHMYLTVYTSNIAENFAIGHATSTDGLTWVMDANSILESDGSATWMGSIVGEPGAVVYHDSIYLFFTAAGIQNGLSVQSIGLIRSSNGTNFGSALQVVTRPEEVYPAANNWYGLSTPSALAINDTLYLFTDVAKIVSGNWTQAALHQFKSYGDLTKWYHSTTPIHTMEDFNWTNGDYLSELRSITPLMDDDGLLRIWYAGNRLADISGTDTTYHVTVDSAGIHIDPNYWGIGTSQYQFVNGSTTVQELSDKSEIRIYPNPAHDYIYIEDTHNEEWKIINYLGETVLKQQKSNTKLDISKLPNGVYNLISDFAKNILLVVAH